MKRLQALPLKQRAENRKVVDILTLVLDHDEQAVLAAVELALEGDAPSKTTSRLYCTDWSMADLLQLLPTKRRTGHSQLSAPAITRRRSLG